MGEDARIWTESIFNLFYLIAIWSLVAAMIKRRNELSEKDIAAAKCFYTAFFLLALGDTGHVGARVLAYSSGGLERNGILVGMGALATAITVTFFYVLVLKAWKVRYGEGYGWFGLMLFSIAAVRLTIMAFPQNRWGSVVPPFDWSLYRNLPLIVQGLGAAFLILRNASVSKDSTFRWIGIMILVSYTCYSTVIFLVQKYPMIGMLMIPKTIAYLAAGFIAYYGFYGKPGTRNKDTTNSPVM